MSLSINSFSNGIFGYGNSNTGTSSNINTNSKQYKAAARDYLADRRAEVAKMSPQERMMYELFGGEEAYMKNVMKMYNSDGDYVGADGSVVPGMVATGIPESERHQMINVSEEYRQKMFNIAIRDLLIICNEIKDIRPALPSDVLRCNALSSMTSLTCTLFIP